MIWVWMICFNVLLTSESGDHGGYGDHGGHGEVPRNPPSLSETDAYPGK